MGLSHVCWRGHVFIQQDGFTVHDPRDRPCSNCWSASLQVEVRPLQPLPTGALLLTIEYADSARHRRPPELCRTGRDSSIHDGSVRGAKQARRDETFWGAGWAGGWLCFKAMELQRCASPGQGTDAVLDRDTPGDCALNAKLEPHESTTLLLPQSPTPQAALPPSCCTQYWPPPRPTWSPLALPLCVTPPPNLLTQCHFAVARHLVLTTRKVHTINSSPPHLSLLFSTSRSIATNLRKQCDARADT